MYGIKEQFLEMTEQFASLDFGTLPSIKAISVLKNHLAVCGVSEEDISFIIRLIGTEENFSADTLEEDVKECTENLVKTFQIAKDNGFQFPVLFNMKIENFSTGSINQAKFGLGFDENSPFEEFILQTPVFKTCISLKEALKNKGMDEETIKNVFGNLKVEVNENFTDDEEYFNAIIENFSIFFSNSIQVAKEKGIEEYMFKNIDPMSLTCKF